MSAIAKTCKGGGHKSASGLKLNEIKNEKLIEKTEIEKTSNSIIEKTNSFEEAGKRRNSLQKFLVLVVEDNK